MSRNADWNESPIVPVETEMDRIVLSVTLTGSETQLFRRAVMKSGGFFVHLAPTGIQAGIRKATRYVLKSMVVEAARAIERMDGRLWPFTFDARPETPEEQNERVRMSMLTSQVGRPDRRRLEGN